jgi:hypothetical protein
MAKTLWQNSEYCCKQIQQAGDNLTNRNIVGEQIRNEVLIQLCNEYVQFIHRFEGGMTLKSSIMFALVIKSDGQSDEVNLGSRSKIMVRHKPWWRKMLSR